MNIYVFIGGVLSLGVISLYLGLRSKKNYDTSKDYFLAGRQVSFISLTFTLLATQLGGSAILGSAMEAVNSGPFAIGYSLGQALGFLVLGLGLGAAMRKLGISTSPEIFTKRYNSVYLRKFTSIASICSLFGILIAMAVSAKSFLLSVGINNDYITMAFWGSLVIYTMFGGLDAVIQTDIFQAVVLVSILVITLCFALYNKYEFISKAVKAFPYKEAFSSSKSKFIQWSLVPFLFTFVEQDIAQRCFSGKDSRTVSRACLTAAILLIFAAAIAVFFGMISYNTNISDSKNPFMVSVIMTTNPIIAGLAGCAVLAAIISTADSILMAIISNICQDFNFGNSKQSQKSSKMLVGLIGISAFAFSYLGNNIFSILIKSYEISISCMLIPMLVAILDKKEKYSSQKAAWGAALSGLFGFILFIFYTTPPIPKEILTLILSMSGFIGGYLIDKKRL